MKTSLNIWGTVNMWPVTIPDRSTLSYCTLQLFSHKIIVFSKRLTGCQPSDATLWQVWLGSVGSAPSIQSVATSGYQGRLCTEMRYWNMHELSGEVPFVQVSEDKIEWMESWQPRNSMSAWPIVVHKQLTVELRSQVRLSLVPTLHNKSVMVHHPHKKLATLSYLELIQSDLK